MLCMLIMCLLLCMCVFNMCMGAHVCEGGDMGTQGFLNHSPARSLRQGLLIEAGLCQGGHSSYPACSSDPLTPIAWAKIIGRLACPLGSNWALKDPNSSLHSM